MISPQNISVTVLTSDGRHRPGALCVRSSSASVSISFTDTEAKKGKSTAGDSELSFSLSDFQSFRLTPRDPLYLSLVDSVRGRDLSFCFSFHSDVSPFMELIVERFQVIPDAQARDSYVMVPRTGDAPTAPCIFRQRREISLQRVRDRLCAIDAVATAAEVPFSEFRSLFDCAVPKGGIEYSKMKYQWEKVTPQQFANFPALQSIIRVIEADILAEENRVCFDAFPDAQQMQEIAFNVLLTLSLYNFDECKYFNGEIRLLLPILAAYAAEHSGSFDKELCESELFDVYFAFFNRAKFGDVSKPEKQSYVMPALRDAWKAIEESFPELKEALRETYITSIDFMADDISKWFTDVFKSPDDVLVIWKEMLIAPELKAFLTPFIIAVLLLVAPMFAELNMISFEESLHYYNKFKHSIASKDALELAYRIKAALEKK